MKRKVVESERERRLLTAMITSRPFLARASSVIDLELIDAPHFRQIAEWCLAYYGEYGEAPEHHIYDIYTGWAEDNENADLVDSIHDFLEALSERYEEEKDLNVPYLLDDLGTFLAKRRIQRLQGDLEYSLLHGDLKQAEQTIAKYRSVEVGAEASFDPLLDDEVWEEAFAEPMESLIPFGGDAGTFFNTALTRDALIAIQAPEKTGKTWWCVEFVIRALRARKRVALFEVGDLSKSQILTRIGVRLADRPMWPRQCGEIRVPRKIERDDGEDLGYYVSTQTVTKKHPISPASVRRGRRRFLRGAGLPSTKSYLRTSVHANNSINVAGISSLIDQWEVEHSFIPDVIVIDYADILAPENASERETRHKMNDTWKALRRLSQERHALVIAPTQADAGTYDMGGALQSMKNFSEDKRKLGHVTGMIALNQTPEEKDSGGMRLNWIVLRESPFNINRPLYVGTCFTLGRALCCATL